MSVKIQLPPPPFSPATAAGASSRPSTTTPTAPGSSSSGGGDIINTSHHLTLHQRRLHPRPQIMLSEPKAFHRSRENLKLSFNRSISEPIGTNNANVPNQVVITPPSVSPSLHHVLPSKRCRMEMPPPPPQPQTMTNSHHNHNHQPNQTSSAPSPSSSSSVVTTLRPPMPIAAVSLPSSPCSESSTLQRTLLLQNARTIRPDAFASKLESLAVNRRNGGGNNNFLVVDCRPFIAYNVNHIRGSINVNCCDRFNRKRLQQCKATLADLATSKDGKEMLKKRTWKEVIVYDDCSESLEKLPVNHTLFLVLNALLEDNREPVMLLGGLRDFQSSHRSLCEDHLMGGNSSSSSSGASMEFQHNPLPDLPSPSDICDTKDIENHPASQVLPFMFLGNMRDASNAEVLKRLNIKFVLNVTAKPPCYEMDPEIVYKQLEAADNGIQNLRQFFEEAFDFIELAKSACSGVLIHCHAGVSRSPTIAVAYLMKHYPMTMSEAYKFVKDRRSIISPNLNFMGQLWEFEQMLQQQPGQVRKEPLTVEMREVKESIAAASRSSSSSSSSFFSSGAFNAQTPIESKPPSGQTFLWSEATKESEGGCGGMSGSGGVTTGCSV